MGIKLHEMSVTFEPLCFPALRRKTTVQILILILILGFKMPMVAWEEED